MKPFKNKQNKTKQNKTKQNKNKTKQTNKKQTKQNKNSSLLGNLSKPCLYSSTKIKKSTRVTYLKIFSVLSRESQVHCNEAIVSHFTSP